MFGRRFKVFSLLGFDVRVDASWTVLALLVTWTLAAGYFPHQIPGLRTLTYWLMGAAGALGLFVSIVLHEMSHSLVARHYGLPMKGITLFIFGGVAEMGNEPERPRTEFLMAIVGPLASFAIAAVCFAFTRLVGETPTANIATAVLAYLALINLALGIFNLIPAFPLDGGRVLRALLWAWKGNLNQATRLSSQIGGFFGLAMVFFGVMRLISGNFIGGLWMMMIGMFLRNAAAASYEHLLVHRLLDHQPVRRLMHEDVITVPPRLTLDGFVEDFLVRSHHRMYPVVEDDHLLGTITLEEVRRVPRAEWPTTTVGAVMHACEPTELVSPDADAARALEAVRQARMQRLLVVDQDRLLGVLSARDILDFLTVKMSLDGPDATTPRSTPSAR